MKNELVLIFNRCLTCSSQTIIPGIVNVHNSGGRKLNCWESATHTVYLDLADYNINAGLTRSKGQKKGWIKMKVRIKRVKRINEWRYKTFSFLQFCCCLVRKTLILLKKYNNTNTKSSTYQHTHGTKFAASTIDQIWGWKEASKAKQKPKEVKEKEETTERKSPSSWVG